MNKYDLLKEEALKTPFTLQVEFVQSHAFKNELADSKIQIDHIPAFPPNTAALGLHEGEYDGWTPAGALQLN